MVEIRKKGFLWYVSRSGLLIPLAIGMDFRAPGADADSHRPSTGLRRHTVLEVVEYRKAGPEVVVAGGFGRGSDWILNIKASPTAEVTVGLQHFAAQHRFLGEERRGSIKNDERRNRMMHPSFAPVQLDFGMEISWQ